MAMMLNHDAIATKVRFPGVPKICHKYSIYVVFIVHSIRLSGGPTTTEELLKCDSETKLIQIKPIR